MSMVLSLFRARAKSSSNGKPVVATEAQRDRMSDYQRALRGESTWKGVSKLLGGALIASIAYNGILSLSFAPKVVVVDSLTGRALNAATSVPVKDQNVINSAILEFIREVREVSGADYSFVNATTKRAHQQTVPGSEAEAKLLAAFGEQHGPKQNAAKCTRTIVSDNPPPIITPAGGETYTIDYAELTRPLHSAPSESTLTRYTGRVTFAQPPQYTTAGIDLQINDFTLPTVDC